MSQVYMRQLFAITLSAVFLIFFPLQSEAAPNNKHKTELPTKERLVLMPLRVEVNIQNMLGAMETALAQGLQRRYTVFSGEDVAKKTREIFAKESTKKNCDETRCLENIAIAFQAELIAVASVTKIEGGYLLALSIRNVMDNKSVYNNSIPCKNCDAFHVVDKLKELGDASVASTPQTLAAPTADESIIGTHSVMFQPLKFGGALEGCTLVYRAVQFDNANLEGNPVVIIGNIALSQHGENMVFGFKVGIENLAENGTIERPYFAYLQANSHTTANVRQHSFDGDEGFRLYVYSLFDADVMAVYSEMMDTGKITVAFNRKKGGMDVLVPIDLEVIDAEYSSDGKVIRNRTKETMSNFASCGLTLSEQAQSSHEKLK